MQTFTAIALDKLLEPGTSKSMAAVKDAPDSKLARIKTAPNSKPDRAIGVPNPKTERCAPDSRPEYRNCTSAMRDASTNKRQQLAQPALYAIPDSTRLPDSPFFPPSPYIIKHKRRGPCLSRSFSEHDTSAHKQTLDGEKASENANDEETEIAGFIRDDSFTFEQVVVSANNNNLISTIPSPVKEENGNDIRNVTLGSHYFGNDSIGNNFTFAVPGPGTEENVNCVHKGELGSSHIGNWSTGQISRMKSVTSRLERDGEVDDFFDPQDSMSAKSSTEVESNSGVESSGNLTTPMAEFYDAWEELLLEYGSQQPWHDIEAELREIRLSLLVEIEKRKQAEETLINMESKWLRIQQQLSLVGLSLPAESIALENGHQNNPVEDLCQQVYLAGFVSNAIGRGTAKAEVEMEMEALRLRWRWKL